MSGLSTAELLDDGAHRPEVEAEVAGRDQVEGDSTCGERGVRAGPRSLRRPRRRVDHVRRGVPGDAPERRVVGQHATGGGVHAKDRQAVLERDVERAAHAAVLEHVLVRDHVRHAEAEAARQVADAIIGPDVHRALAHGLGVAVALGVAVDHVPRLHGVACAVATEDRATRVGGCHRLLDRRPGDDLHRHGLVAAEDVHAVHVGREVGDVRAERGVRADQDRDELRVTGLVGVLHRVAGVLHLLRPVLGQAQVPLPLAVLRLVGVQRVRDRDHQDDDVAARVAGRGLAGEQLQGVRLVVGADRHEDPGRRVGGRNGCRGGTHQGDRHEAKDGGTRATGTARAHDGLREGRGHRGRPPS